MYQNLNQDNKRLARNSLYMTIRMVIVLCVNLYTTRVVLSILGVEDYGIYNIVCGFVSMLSFLNISMSNGIQRFYNYELGKSGEDGATKVFNTAICIQIILAIIILLICESFGLWYLYNKLVIPDGRLIAALWIFQFSMFSFLLTILVAPFTAAVMAHERMDFYAIINVVDAVLKFGIVFLLPCINIDTLILYGLLLTTISIVDFFAYVLYCRANFIEVKRVNGFQKELFKSMLLFSGWNVLGSLSSILRDQGVNLIMNLFYGPIINAARGIAMQINSALNGFVSNILTPARPQIIQSYSKGELVRSFNLTFSLSKLSVIFLYIMALPVCLEINYILHCWLGQNVPEHCNSFVIIILITTAVLVLMGAMATMVHASGEMKRYQLCGFFIKTLSVPTSYFVLKSGAEPEFALYLVLIFDILGFVVGLFIIKTIMPFSICKYTKDVILPILLIFVISLLATLPLHLYMQEGLVRVMAILFASFFSICLTTYLVGLNFSEKELAKTLFMKILHNS